MLYVGGMAAATEACSAYLLRCFVPSAFRSNFFG